MSIIYDVHDCIIRGEYEITTGNKIGELSLTATESLSMHDDKVLETLLARAGLLQHGETLTRDGDGDIECQMRGMKGGNRNAIMLRVQTDSLCELIAAHVALDAAST